MFRGQLVRFHPLRSLQAHQFIGTRQFGGFIGLATKKMQLSAVIQPETFNITDGGDVLPKSETSFQAK